MTAVTVTPMGPHLVASAEGLQRTRTRTRIKATRIEKSEKSLNVGLLYCAGVQDLSNLFLERSRSKRFL